jgi:hypothetical protein
MIVFVKSSGLGANLGPSFSLAADVGTVSPSSITGAQLLNGLNVEVDEEATNISIASLGACSNYITVNIVNNCVDGHPTSTPTLTPTATPATTATPTLTPTNTPTQVVDLRQTPVRQTILQKNSLDYIFDLNIGDSFEFTLFEEVINFSISSKRTKEDGTLMVLATRENMRTFYIYLQKDLLTNSIKFNMVNTLEGNMYQYNSLNQENPQLKEWNRDSFIQICK